MNRDLRRYANQTNFRLFAGFLLILFLIGDGLIYAFYGRSAAVLGFLCMILGLLPLLLIGLALWIMDMIVRRANQE